MTRILIIDEGRYFIFSSKDVFNITTIFEDSKSSLLYNTAKEYLDTPMFDKDRIRFEIIYD